MGLDKFVNAWMGGLFVVMLSFFTFLPIYWVYDHHTGTVRVPCEIVETSSDVPKQYKDECVTNRKGRRL